MALMDWAIDVPQRLLQCDAISDNLIIIYSCQYKDRSKEINNHSVSCKYYFCLFTRQFVSIIYNITKLN